MSASKRSSIPAIPAIPAIHGSGEDTTLSTSAHATAHCLAGCMIGEVAGLAIGVTFGLGVIATIAHRDGSRLRDRLCARPDPAHAPRRAEFARGLRRGLAGEAVSIAAMEIAMNAVDYLVGGMGADSVIDPMFWIAIAAAAPAGFPRRMAGPITGF